MDEGVSEIEAAASYGHPHARSVLGFLHGSGQMREKNKAKAFMYHHFAAEGGNMQSKMSLAYTYFKQDVLSHSKFLSLQNSVFCQVFQIPNCIMVGRVGKENNYVGFLELFSFEHETFFFPRMKALLGCLGSQRINGGLIYLFIVVQMQNCELFYSFIVLQMKNFELFYFYFF